MATRLTADPETDPTRGSLGRLILGVARDLRTAFERQLDPLGITSQQAELLHRTHVHGQITPNELTRLLMTDNASVTRLVDRLVAKGLIARRPSPHDRRSIRVALTPAGRAIVPRIARIAEEQKRRLFAGFGSADQRRLREFLQRVSKNARASADE